MRRRRLQRALALPLGLWFVGLSVNLGGIDVCPMDHEMTQAGTMAMPLMATGPSHAPAPDHPGQAPHCTGICCCCSALMTLPSANVTLPVVAVVPVRDAAPNARRAVPAAAPQVLQPPANGPPARHTA